MKALIRQPSHTNIRGQLTEVLDVMQIIVEVPGETPIQIIQNNSGELIIYTLHGMLVIEPKAANSVRVLAK